MPGFVTRLINSWTVTLSGDPSRVDLELAAEIAFPCKMMMGPIMKLQFGRVLRESTEEVEHDAETGRPHPRKVKADVSEKAASARAAYG